MGARFTKWRAVITIGDGIPTVKCVESNARALALYAAFSQEAGLVPIVEPEVLIDGDHSIEHSFEVNEWTLRRTYEAMYEQGVHLEGTLLKPNFVINGKDASEKASVEDVARYTIECFMRSVPASVPGIVLLSGGQSGEDATAHLNAMKSMYESFRGRSPSPGPGRCRAGRWRSGAATSRTSRRHRRSSNTAPGWPPPPPPATTPGRWNKNRQPRAFCRKA
jgi:fructose-bisphosphate aldolase class 1